MHIAQCQFPKPDMCILLIDDHCLAVIFYIVEVMYAMKIIVLAILFISVFAVGVIVGAYFAMAPIEYYDCDWEEDRDDS